MGMRRKVYKGFAQLAVGQVATQSLSLLRNIIVARMLTPEDMGIAATFAITLSFLEMISNMAVDMFLVQTKDGDDPRVQHAAQLFQLGRGILIGIIIYALAPLMTVFFKTPQAEWAYQLVAVVPVLRGFMHLDWKREQRHLRYRPTILVDVIPQLMITFVAYFVVIKINDYSAVLWLVLGQTLISVVMSHLVATRPYRLSVNKEYLNRIFIFGWPLLINGLLIFIGTQGDRFIIGTTYSMSVLGVYSVAISLVVALNLIVAKICTSIFLPTLASVQGEQREFRRRYIIGVNIMVMIGGVVALPFIIFGGDIVTMIFGEQYSSAHTFVRWFGALIVVRVFRIAPTVATLALGDTITPMVANIYRMLGICGAVLVALYMKPIYWMIVCVTLGEWLAFIVTVKRVRKKSSILFSDTLKPSFVVVMVLFISAGINSFTLTGMERLIGLVFCKISLLFMMLITLPVFRGLVKHELYDMNTS